MSIKHFQALSFSGVSGFRPCSGFPWRRTAAISARGSGRPPGGLAAAARSCKGREELLNLSGTALGAADARIRRPNELLELLSALAADVFEYGHSSYLLFSPSAGLEPLPVPFPFPFSFPYRSPISHVPLIQVGTPNEGRTSFMMTNQAARKIRMPHKLFMNRSPFRQVEVKFLSISLFFSVSLSSERRIWSHISRDRPFAKL